jgi:hypothetical protein
MRMKVKEARTMKEMERGRMIRRPGRTHSVISVTVVAAVETVVASTILALIIRPACTTIQEMTRVVKAMKSARLGRRIARRIGRAARRLPSLLSPNAR